MLRLGITDLDEEHEAIELRFRERIGAFLFDRVLGRHDQKKFRQRVSDPTDRHLPLCHGFQQGRLNLGR